VEDQAYILTQLKAQRSADVAHRNAGWTEPVVTGQHGLNTFNGVFEMVAATDHGDYTTQKY